MTLDAAPSLKHVLRREKEMIETMIKDKERATQKSTCAYCDCETQKILGSEMFFFYISGEKKKIVVKNIPMDFCENCDSKTSDFDMICNIEKALDKEIYYRLNNHMEQIPEEFDYQKLFG